MQIKEASSIIVDTCKKLHQQGFLAAADGNVSVKLDSGEVLITPGGVAKADIGEEDLVLLDKDGDSQKGQASSEKLMHLKVYEMASRARCVIHAHPPCAIAWSIARPDLKELPAGAIPEVVLATGGIPFVPYARPASKALADSLVPYLEKHQALILSHHGALTWGESLAEAYRGIERIEHAAVTLKYAIDLGGINSLPAKELEALKSLRAEIGDRLL